MPGPMPTPMADKDPSGYHKEGIDLSSKTMATGLRWSPLEEVARTIALLCSSGIGTVNGALVSTDYGWTCC